jgi:hypothetical protein
MTLLQEDIHLLSIIISSQSLAARRYFVVFIYELSCDCRVLIK